MTTRRTFLRQLMVIGPATMVFWIETKDGLGLMQNPECTLPDFNNATELIPNEAKVLTRFSAAEMAASGALPKFREAFQKIQDLSKANPNDLSGWTKQVAQHCVHCGGGTVGPNQIHYSQKFLPWHRVFLYMVERVLRKLSNDDNLRLVYWNWENSNSRVVPAIYPPPGQSLYWSNRGNFPSSLWPLRDAAVNVKTLLLIPDFPTFGGGSGAGQTGAAFGGPHANVHNAFAPNGDMRDLLFSPRDPVFYAHHGNIDRLWSSWARLHPEEHRKTNFGEDKAYFYDEDRKLRFIKFNNVKDETKLGYRYSSYMESGAQVKTLERFAMAGTNAEFAISAAAERKMSQVAGPRILLVRNIQNLEKFPEARTFGIFADQPAVGTQNTQDPLFLGTVATVFSGHEKTGPLTAALDVTDKLPNIAKEKHKLNLVVAPLDDEGKVSAQPIPVAAENVSVIE